jgi:site-specific recombinase XerC
MLVGGSSRAGCAAPKSLRSPSSSSCVTRISHLIEDEFDPLFVQQQVGHSWASTTAVYTTVGADAKNRVLRAALDRAFNGEGRR